MPREEGTSSDVFAAPEAVSGPSGRAAPTLQDHVLSDGYKRCEDDAIAASTPSAAVAADAGTCLACSNAVTLRAVQLSDVWAAVVKSQALCVFLLAYTVSYAMRLLITQMTLAVILAWLSSFPDRHTSPVLPFRSFDFDYGLYPNANVLGTSNCSDSTSIVKLPPGYRTPHQRHQLH
ncbi:hypothetical protein MRX96_049455 [Rhipicephalus microplus]